MARPTLLVIFLQIVRGATPTPEQLAWRAFPISAGVLRRISVIRDVQTADSELLCISKWRRTPLPRGAGAATVTGPPQQARLHFGLA